MINAAFKVFWDNPIEMKTEVGEQPLEFNIPLGVIIADPSVSSDLSNYYTKPETNLQITNAVATKVDTSVFTQAMTLKADLVNGKVPSSQLPTMSGLTLGETSTEAYRGDRGKTAYDHSQTTGNPHNTTTAEITEVGNLWFTENRVLTTIMNGVSFSNTSAVVGTDNLIQAVGKLQAQVNTKTSLTLGTTSTTALAGNSTTSNVVEGSNLYFTDTRAKAAAIAAPLTGLSVATGGTITSSDTVIGALGKLQNQVTNSGGGSSSPAWVNITTVGTIPAYVTNADIQVARFQGMLWIKGTFNVNTNVATNSELFRITAQTYKPYAYSTAGTGRLLMLFNCVNMTSANKLIGFSALGNITNSTQALTVDVIFEAKTALATTDGTLNIVPTIISNLAY